MVLQILILFMILFVLPTLVGGIFAAVEREGGLLFRWVSGQFCLWAGFLLICVPVILIRQGDGFADVVKMNVVFAAAMLLFSAGVEVKRRVTAVRRPPVEKSGRRADPLAAALWVPVLGLLALQLILAVTLAYEEGDDAFYVATASVTAESETMYKVLPYTGGATGFDARHGLAPFPVWVAMLGRLSGMHPAAVAHVALPVALILMAYAVFYMLGRHLFREGGRRLPLFLLFLELLILCGGQSLYTAENFLLVRTAQGKAVLAQIVIPFLLFLLTILLERLQQGGRMEPGYWLLLGLAALSGSLCSTQGVLLTAVLLGGVSVLAAFVYRRWKVLLPTAACCAVPTALAFLYFFVD